MGSSPTLQKEKTMNIKLMKELKSMKAIPMFLEFDEESLINF